MPQRPSVARLVPRTGDAKGIFGAHAPQSGSNRFGPREVISEGNKAAAFGWFRLHALSTGRTIDISYSILFELRAGLIVRYHFIENTFDVAAAFWSGGSWLVDTDGAKHNVPAQGV
jgi:ketosteroid isomerase-like protein